MMLIEQTTVPGSALPVQELKDHLRLGTGFSSDGMQDALIESYLRAAMAAIEARTSKALIARRFLLKLEDWRNGSEQALPVAPVIAVVSVSLIDAAEVATVLTNDRYRLIQDTHRPRLAAKGILLPLAPTDGRIEVVFDAGFGTTWTTVPADLRQAVLLLGAEYYDHRHELETTTAGLPFPVQTLIEKWRTVRILGGGTA